MIIEVHKFGGSVLALEAGFRNMCEFIEKSEHKSVVIISAIGQTSSKLRTAIHEAENNNINSAENILNDIFDKHIYLAEKVLTSNNYVGFLHDIGYIRTNAAQIIKSVAITRETTGKTYDKFLSFGEDLAIHLAKSYFFDDGSVDFVDARIIIRTNNDYMNAVPDISISYKLINQYLQNALTHKNTIFVQGFVGSDSLGNTTTMGFESSNLTATMIADCLNAKQVTIWSDVDGIFATDPKDFPNNKLVSSIDYSSALSAGLSGLKLIYPEMVQIARNNNTIIKYRNGINFSEKYTVISEDNHLKSSLFIVKEILQSDSLLFDSQINESNNSPEHFNNHFKTIRVLSQEEGSMYVFYKDKELINRFEDELKSSHRILTEIAVINPNKSDILTIISKYFKNEINSGDIVILSGFSDNFMAIIIKENKQSKLTGDIINKLL